MAVRTGLLVAVLAPAAPCCASRHPPMPGLRPIPITASWAWSVYEPSLQPWAARETSPTLAKVLSFHQPGLNIHTTALGDELLVQGDPGGQVLRSTDGGASFGTLCPCPGPASGQGSGVGVLRDGTLLAATNQEQILTKTFIVAHTMVHRAEVTRSAGSGDGTIEMLCHSATQFCAAAATPSLTRHLDCTQSPDVHGSTLRRSGHSFKAIQLGAIPRCGFRRRTTALYTS